MSNEKQMYKLARPITFDGKEVTELKLDFDQLSGEDLLLCSQQAQALAPNEVPTVKAFSLPYQVTVAARAAGMPAELIKALKAKDFTQVTQRAQNFLIGSE